MLKEAKRNFSYLHLFDFNVDAIVVNKIYPKESLPGYFHKWIKNQEEALEDIKVSFAGVPIFYLELLRHELRTIERMKGVSTNLYGNINPEGVLFRDTIFTTERIGDKDFFRIALPFFDLNDMELTQKGDELTLVIKNERRKFVLPNKLKSKEIKSAKYENGKLNIIF